VVTKARGKPQDSREGGEWVENELRETKARLHKVESELAQALKQTYSLDTDLRKLMESLAVTGSVEAALQAFREEVRQMRDSLSRVQDRQSAITARMEQIQNQRQAEIGRDRHDLGVVVKQVEALNRVVEQSDGRMKALEEVARHVEEEVAGNRLTNQAIERTMEELNTRSARTHEAAMRLDQEVNRHTGEIEKMEQVDDNMVDKMTLFLEQLRRALERLDKVEQLNEFPEEVRESLDKAAFERDQLNDRVAAMERLAGEIAERTDEFVQSLARLDQRSQQHAGDLLKQAGQLQDLADQTKTGLKKIYQVLLRQRRRASEALNQEIKELTQGELHAGD
jgi:chromosome segregation ATPase